MKQIVITAALGGLFVGASVTGLLFNSVLKSPAIFTGAGIGGLICGVVVVALAYAGAK